MEDSEERAIRVRRATADHERFMASRTFDKVPDVKVFVNQSELDKGYPAFKLFYDFGMTKSNGDSRRLISQGGAYVNDERVKTFDQAISLKDVQSGKIVLRIGKKRHLIIHVKGD